MAFDLIQIDGFPETSALLNWLVTAGEDGEGKKISIDNVKAELGIDALMQFGGAIVPASTPEATGDYFWIATEEGTYTNFGGVVVPANSIAVISRVDGVFTSSITEIQPQDLSGLVEKSSILSVVDPDGQQFDKSSDVFINFYVNGSGDLAFNSGGFAYAKIDLSNKGSNSKLTFSGVKVFVSGVHKYAAFYQGETKLTSGQFVDWTSETTLDIPATADNVIVTVDTPETTSGQVDALMVNYGTEALPISPYGKVVVGIDGSPIKNADKDVYEKSQTYSKAEVDAIIPEPINFDKEIIVGLNLANPANILNGYVLTTANNGTAANSSWRMIWVPCNELVTHRVDGWNGASSGIAFFSGAYPTTANNNTNIISSGSAGSQGIVRDAGGATFETPAGCTWFAITLRNASETDAVFAQLMITEGSEQVPYQPYGDTTIIVGVDGEKIGSEYVKIGNEYISTDLLQISSDSGGKGTFSFDYNAVKTLNLIYPEGTITILMGRDEGYTRNNVFEFHSFNIAGVTQVQGDDAAPVHAMNYTLGGNHGGQSWTATIASHGFTNTDIGTLFTQGANTFVLARIINSNQLQFIPENIGTAESPAWNAMTTGIVSRSGTDYTVTAIASSQVYPFIKNHIRKLYVDGIEVEAGTSGRAQKVEVRETYDIKILESVYDNLVARAGTSGDLTFDGDAFMKVENIYRFTSGMACLVLTNNRWYVDTAFADLMVTQSGIIGPSVEVQYYVPNSNPLNGSVDLRKPTQIDWGGAIPSTFVTVASAPDPLNPPHRVIMYRGDLGYMTGYITDRGTGKSIEDYTNRTFEIRSNTGKIYPHPVEGAKVGSPIPSDTVFSTGMYRVYTDLRKTRIGNRLSVFTVLVEDNLYAYIDYSGSMLDKVGIDTFSLNGKEIEVVEQSNATLESDIYNEGFYVNATYVEGETCYLVVKIRI